MGLVNITPIEDGTSATANSINEPIGKLAGAINGNLDTANLANNAVTTAKIADGSITSAKLGFQKYVDDNGWTITDLGLVKLASKARQFTIPSVGNGAIGFVSVADNSTPVGWTEGQLQSTQITISITNGNAYRWSLNLESNVLRPNALPVYKNVGGGTFDCTGILETWTIF